MDNIQIDTTCPKVKCWYQYSRVPAIKNYFDFLQSYWQAKFFDFTFKITPTDGIALGTAAGEMSIYNSTTDYLFYYSTNVLGIKIRPSVLLGSIPYDSGFHYDDPTVFYDQVPIVVASQQQFKVLLKWIFDWSRDDWTIPSLFDLLKKFTGLDMSDIEVVQDDTNLDLITITMPNTTGTLLFQSMLTFYKPLLFLPYGIDFVVVLV